MRNLNPAASQAVDWIAELQPVQGAANPSGNLVFSSQVNGGGYTPQIVFLSGGGIGVGTATPNYFMQLSSPAGVNALLQITNGSVGTEATHGAYFGQISGQTLFRIYQLENDDILFATNNAEAMRIKNTGHLTLTAASAPGTPTSCGTSPTTTAGSTDVDGELTTGSTATTSCVLPFANTYTSAPRCVATAEGSTVTAVNVTPAAANITFNYASSTSVKILYHCAGQSGAT